MDFLKKITKTSLCSSDAVPTGEGLLNPSDSAKNVWVPNRNGLFLNIAASFADSEDFDYIIIGANLEESATFPDNTKEFTECAEKLFEYSTQNHPKVLAPLINCTKNDIVKLAVENRIPLNYVQSCYLGGDKHCGKCESLYEIKKCFVV